MAPRILLAASYRWFAGARLATALKRAGFAVEAVCPARHPILKTSAVVRIRPYCGLWPVESIRAAIRETRPDLVIPCDDLATGHLHSLSRAAARAGGSSAQWLSDLLERSLGDATGYPVAAARSSLIALADAEGVRVPATAVIENANELRAWLDRHGLPAVLKTDGSSGGVGVRLVHTAEEATWAFAALNAPPITAKMIKRAIVDRDVTLVRPWLLRRRPRVSVQRLIRGHDATSTACCWQGKVLALLRFDVLHTWGPKGPASVIRVSENPEILSAVATIAAKLRLSGLYGFDFMIEESTGKSFLIEMNPRATQTSHLALGPGRDLPCALWSAVSGEPARETESITTKSEIALFPQEWQRDPASPFLRDAFHDVPWDQPELVRACIRSRLSPSAGSPLVLAHLYAALLRRRISDRAFLSKARMF